MPPFRVKICGITCLEDGLAAAEAGADAIGLMFYRPSVRYIEPTLARSITEALPPLVHRVGVFVNPTAAEVRETLAACPLDALQFHGEESLDFCRQFGLRVIKAFRMRDASSLPELARFPVEAWLLDAYVEGQRGGAGRTFNWDLAVQAKTLGRPILLAGGLHPDNVAAAIAQVQPYGVDVSSGVENTPGRKDPVRLRAFMQAVRGARA